MPRYLKGAWGRGVRAVPGPQASERRWPRKHSLIAHVDETFAVDGKELLPVHLLQLIREAVQEVVHP